MARIGFIGAGNMGAAIMTRLAQGAHSLAAFDLDATKLEGVAVSGVTPAGSLDELMSESDFLVMAVKPQHLPVVVGQMRLLLENDKRLISIAAGISLKSLTSYVDGKCPVVRVMPNTPAMVGKGCTAICYAPDETRLTDGDRQTIEDIFRTVGDVHILAEKDFDAFTAVVGSGPAYVFYFMDAAIEAAVRLGLPRPAASDMVKALFAGSSELAKQSDLSPVQLREMVSSPAGTTIEAVVHMDRTAVRGHFIDAITACCERSRELGKD